MSHALTEVATFDPTVTVPDGTDSGAVRAANVAAISQVLANRSQYLKILADGAAQKSGGNTFTGTNNFGAINATTVTATGAVTAGSFSTSGAFNAGSIQAHSLTLTGPGAFIDSPTLQVLMLQAVAAPYYWYSTPVQILSNMNLVHGQSARPLPSAAGEYECLLVSGLGVTFSGTIGGHWEQPIDVPHGCQLDQVVVVAGQPVANTLKFTLYKRQVNYSGATWTDTAIGTADQTFSATGSFVGNLTFPATTIDKQNCSYYLLVTGNGSGLALNGVRVRFQDAGPTNHW